jgi:hypothetical protein
VIGPLWTVLHGGELQPKLQPELSAWELHPSALLFQVTCGADCPPMTAADRYDSRLIAR